MPDPGPRPTRDGLWVEPRGGCKPPSVSWTGAVSAAAAARRGAARRAGFAVGFAFAFARGFARAFALAFAFALAIAYPFTGVTRTRWRT